jgi:hypothetical protein
MFGSCNQMSLRNPCFNFSEPRSSAGDHLINAAVYHILCHVFKKIRLLCSQCPSQRSPNFLHL